MTLFDDRKDAFEKAFVKDGIRDFNVEARLARLFGIWMAEQLGLEGEHREIYAREVVSANLKEPGFEDIFERVQKDIDEKGLDIPREKMEAVLRKYMLQAQEEVE